MSNIIREINNRTDNTFLIFMGSTVDAALDPDVMDWIYFSGGIIEQPFQRLFSTIAYSRQYMEKAPEEAKISSEHLRKMHDKLETKRSEQTGQQHHIPNASFLRVLSGIIEYGIRGHEYLNRKSMCMEDKESFYQHNALMGTWMHIDGVPKNYVEWEKYRHRSYVNEYKNNKYTEKFYSLLRETFGPFGFWVITNFQVMFVSPVLGEKMKFKKPNWVFRQVYALYPHVRNDFMLKLAIRLVVPEKGRRIVLDIVENKTHIHS